MALNRHRHMIVGVFVTAVFGGFSATGFAENWPRFRGPDGTGIATPGFSTALAEKDVAWKTDLPGVGHSSPVVWADHVYLTSADEQGTTRHVLCLSAADGSVLWKHDEAFAAYRKHRENSYTSATPAADDLGVYVAWTMPNEFTLLARGHDGKERWRKSLGHFRSQHGSGSSPIVAGGLVIVNDDQEGETSTVYALDRTTGEIRWKLDRPGGGKAAMSTPCLWSPPGGPKQLIVTTWQAGIEGIDFLTGKVLWQAKDVFFSRPIGSPVTTADLVIGVNGEGTASRVLVAIRPGPVGQPPKVVYKLDLIGPHVPTPLIKGEFLYMWNELGQLTCAKAATGEVVWSQKLDGTFYSSPICSGDVLWSVGRKGELVGVNITAGYKPLCTLSLGEASSATPAIANGRMYLRTISHLICVKSHGE